MNDISAILNIIIHDDHIKQKTEIARQNNTLSSVFLRPPKISQITFSVEPMYYLGEPSSPRSSHPGPNYSIPFKKIKNKVTNYLSQHETAFSS